MSDEKRKPRFAVEGKESIESEETLGRDELGRLDEPLPPPSPPISPPRGFLARLWRSLRRR